MDESLSKIDARIDSELSPEEEREIDAHLTACPACRAERDSRAALKQALGRLALPPAPRRVTMDDLRASRPWRWTAAAAAVLVMAAVLLSLPAPLPPVVALSVQLHEDFVRGSLGLEVSRPVVDPAGDCTCCRGIGASSPFVVYRMGGVPISLLIVEAEAGPLPASARRPIEGRDVHVFRAGADVAIVCQSGKLCHVWVSRIEESALARAIPATREGRRLFSGTTLEGITCTACCSVLESRGPGPKDAIQVEKADLVLTRDGTAIDLQKVIRAIQSARGPAAR